MSFDFWYKQRKQVFKIGDYFYLTQAGTLKKVKNQTIVNIKFGIKTPLHDIDYGELIHKVCKIEGDKVYFSIKESLKMIK